MDFRLGGSMSARASRTLRAAILAVGIVVIVGPGCLAFAAPQQKQGPVGKVNINTATRTELMQIPKIGEKMAERIVEFRKANGPFTRVEELLNVKGMGEKTFLSMRHQLTVGARSPGGARQQGGQRPQAGTQPK
jgi:competence protein ComEA